MKKRRQFSHLIIGLDSSKIRFKKPEHSWMIDVVTSDWKKDKCCVLFEKEKKKKKTDPFIPAFVLKQKLNQLPGSKKHFQIERKKKKSQIPLPT